MIYQYTTIKSDRRTTCISISPLNEIIVKCPYSSSKAKIDKFLDDRQFWIYSVLTENAKKLLAHSDVVEFKKIYVYGNKVPLVLGEKNNITETEVSCKSKKDLYKTYVQFLGEKFIAEAEEISRELNIEPKSFNIKQYKGRWGSCDKRGNITLNYLLMMLSYDLRRYVIVHELCHIRYFNHSASFWAEVKKYVPNYSKLKKDLKDYTFLIDLYV
jgi:hypothetical protein